jgi:hypothetical protein
VADTWRLSVRNAGATSVLLPTDLYSRVVEYVFLSYLSIYLRFLKICTGANLDEGSNKNITFTRRYLDLNRVTYEVTFFCPAVKVEKHIECLDSSIQRRTTRISTLGMANPLPKD